MDVAITAEIPGKRFWDSSGDRYKNYLLVYGRICKQEPMGIGIEVVEEFQNKGVATATAAHFLEHCMNQNIVAHWECDKENIGSVRVAEKAGFEKIEEAVFWSGQFLR